MSMYSPQISSAAARIAGSTVSRVVFMRSSANHSKTSWICCGLGFWRSAGENGTPMSLIHPAISLSGWNHRQNARGGLCNYIRGRTHQAHECVAIVFLLSTPAIVAVGIAVWIAKLLAYTRIEIHA